jgi:hypothetical protein
MWCLQHAHPWYKKNEIVFNLLLCVRVCTTSFLVFRNLVDITLWSSDQSIAYCEGFVVVLAEHQGHNFQNLIIFISLYKTEENTMLMNLMCISSISILIQRKMNYHATEGIIWLQRCLFTKFVEKSTCPLLLFTKAECCQCELAGCILLFDHMQIELYCHKPSGEDVAHPVLTPSCPSWLNTCLVHNPNKR